jgi:hypothetical protein
LYKVDTTGHYGVKLNKPDTTTQVFTYMGVQITFSNKSNSRIGTIWKEERENGDGE